MNLRRPLALSLALLALPLAACGGNKEEVVTHGETEGAYLAVGDLVYQVQISRILNPNSNTDQSYLVDVPEDERDLDPDEAWFAVFLLVQNDEGDEPAEAATDFEIHDTQGNVYQPLTIGLDNVFAYRGGTVEPGDTLPEENTIARMNPSVGGALLLFKVKNFSLDNRPLELIIEQPGADPEEATVDLDV